MPYIYIIIILSSFAVGGLSGYKIEHSNVLKLELAIANANAQSAAVMSYAKEKVAKATNEAVIANINLDKAHDSDIKTINTYRDSLATARLRDPHRKNCSNTMPSRTGTVKHTENEPDGGDLSENLTRLLQSESYRADTCAVEKNELLAFVKDQNCGIKP